MGLLLTSKSSDDLTFHLIVFGVWTKLYIKVTLADFNYWTVSRPTLHQNWSFHEKERAVPHYPSALCSTFTSSQRSLASAAAPFLEITSTQKTCYPQQYQFDITSAFRCNGDRKNNRQTCFGSLRVCVESFSARPSSRWVKRARFCLGEQQENEGHRSETQTMVLKPLECSARWPANSECMYICSRDKGRLQADLVKMGEAEVCVCLSRWTWSVR